MQSLFLPDCGFRERRGRDGHSLPRRSSCVARNSHSIIRLSACSSSFRTERFDFQFRKGDALSFRERYWQWPSAGLAKFSLIFSVLRTRTPADTPHPPPFFLFSQTTVQAWASRAELGCIPLHRWWVLPGICTCFYFLPVIMTGSSRSGPSCY